MGIATWPFKRSVASLAAVLVFLAGTACGADAVDESTDFSKNHPQLTVLGYVTPWNSRGKELVEEYRAKFDIVSPVWYTIHANEGQANVYEVKGAPPSDEDAEWYRRLQQESPSGLAPLEVAPRFMLDGWAQSDYEALVFNQTRWSLLSDSIMAVVADMDYDGIVFESGATHALLLPLSAVSKALRAQEKLFIVVSPPIRKVTSEIEAQQFKAHNDVVLRSIGPLAEISDYFSIMTYDMTGPAGRASTRELPEGSPVEKAQRQGNVREPASNTNVAWVKENLDAFMFASDPANLNPEYVNDRQFEFMPDSETGFLVGLPLYGYSYPILFFDEYTGELTRPKSPKDAVATLRGPGEPITMVEIEKLLKQHSPEVLQAEDGEYYFDHVQGNGFTRTYMPKRESMTRVIESILGDNHHLSDKVGVALWEVGQSSKDLLSYL